MYLLPDGREFYLFWKYNKENRLGKVLVEPDKYGGRGSTLRNEVVREDILRECQLVPAGEERWEPSSDKRE